jgi:hypothetical protein
MKPKIFILIPVLFLSLVLVSCRNGKSGSESISSDVVDNPNTANGTMDASKLPAFKFDEIVHDFGKIIEGETVSFNFKFKNVGKTDLLIADVSTSCGCTVPSFPKTPIRPGEEGIIKISFSSAGKHGFITKNIVVVANTQPNTTPLRIKAQVVNPGGDK